MTFAQPLCPLSQFSCDKKKRTIAVEIRMKRKWKKREGTTKNHFLFHQKKAEPNERKWISFIFLSYRFMLKKRLKKNSKENRSKNKWKNMKNCLEEILTISHHLQFVAIWLQISETGDIFYHFDKPNSFTQGTNEESASLIKPGNLIWRSIRANILAFKTIKEHYLDAGSGVITSET